MRDKFELCCKVIGLVLFCYGVVYVLSMIPTYFNQPKAEMFFPKSAMNDPISRKYINDFMETMPNMMAYITVQLFLLGVFPALFGIYLMRSNNLFVRFCYPISVAGQHYEGIESLELTATSEKKESPEEGQGDTKYAPPGYHS